MDLHDVPLTNRRPVTANPDSGTMLSPFGSTNRIFSLLFSLCAFFALFSFALYSLTYLVGDFTGLTSLINLFSVDLENSVPTWFSSQVLFLCAAVLYLIFAAKRTSTERFTRLWLGLTVIFLAFSVDEIVSFHEGVIGIALQNAFDLSGILYFGWVVPAAAFVLFFAVIYLRLFLNLPPRTRWLFLLAALLYVGGALGVELVGGYYFDLYGGENVVYAGITTVEETMEMVGAVLFLYALVDYLKTLRSPLLSMKPR